MSEPRTEAGRDMLDSLTDPLANGLAAWDRELATEAILAIEREAAAPQPPDVERLQRYEDHVGGLHCPEWHPETCEWQERCDEPGCKQEATNGFPTSDGYRCTCSEHAEFARLSRKEPSK